MSDNEANLGPATISESIEAIRRALAEPKAIRPHQLLLTADNYEAITWDFQAPLNEKEREIIEQAKFYSRLCKGRRSARSKGHRRKYKRFARKLGRRAASLEKIRAAYQSSKEVSALREQRLLEIKAGKSIESMKSAIRRGWKAESRKSLEDRSQQELADLPRMFPEIDEGIVEASLPKEMSLDCALWAMKHHEIEEATPSFTRLLSIGLPKL